MQSESEVYARALHLPDWEEERRQGTAADVVRWLQSELETEDAQLLFYDFAPSASDGERPLTAIASFPSERRIVVFSGRLEGEAQSWPSLARHWPGVLWLEREMWEKTGLEPIGHPDLRPILHPENSALRGVAHGSGVFHLPLGPVRADVSESGLFLFDTIGEQIMHMQPQLFYKRRDIEALGVGRSASDVMQLAERITGTSTVAHAVAYARAVEQAVGVAPPAFIERERAFFGEWERLYNHAHDFAQMASAAGMTVGQAQLARAKEDCLRVAGSVTGSRYLRGVIRPFQSSCVDWGIHARGVRSQLDAIDRRVRQFISLLTHTPTFVDRLVRTGILPEDFARAYGVVGPSARACGILNDARAAELAHLYESFGYAPSLPDDPTGDAHARFLVRVGEWTISVRIIRAVLDELVEIAAPPRSRLPLGKGFGLGVAESPRGRVCHAVQLNADGDVSYWNVRAASAWIWPVFGWVTANGNIQTDFPVIDASFGLSYAAVDR